MDDGLLEKRPGLGIFVAAGARQRLLARRRAEFTERYVPGWDAGLASSLLKDFGLRAGMAMKSLSRGQRPALGITIGLARGRIRQRQSRTGARSGR